ncbi:peptidoglycan D,D-transpeptidase FtsI family protein [Devriesea agamarum]|uniref:peptidoglycan D,D-transpeptidase FtsI family protein n=1 Tax=Devriesea agamarum TaxID=472569 RepID=UPI0009FEFEBB|nr:penicillin-binding protein 2 [Devriesea agamarum]
MRSIPPSRVGNPTTRHRAILAVVLVAILVLAGRLVWVQGLNGQALAAQAREERTVTTDIPAVRGEIMDRNGTVLAASIERYDIWVNQLQVVDYGKNNKKVDVKGVKGAAMKLAPVLGMSVDELEQKLTGKRGFLYLAKGVTPQVRDAVIKLKIDGIGSYRVGARAYPAGQVGANIVGFMKADGTPAAGAELSLEKELQGTNGKVTYERGGGGQTIPTGDNTTIPAVDGKDIVLTTDRDLQWKAQDVLAQTVQKWGGTGGSAVVINPRTGEVLALADYPTYDPNAPSKGKDTYWGNRSISNVFEPGSTGKLFTMAALIDQGKVTPETQFTVPYEKYFEGERIKDSHEHSVQKLTLAGVLKNSSNVGTVMASLKVEPSVRYDYLKKFGFGSPTGIDLPGESGGILHPANEWHGRTKFTTAFGQGYAVTALQVTSAVGTFANGGVHVSPTIVRGEQQQNGTIKPLHEKKQTQVVSPQTASTILQMMSTNVPDNPKETAYVPGYAVGGKTGTAQEPGGTYTASFIGTAPVDSPQLVVGVFVYGLKTFISGSQAAAPAFSEIMQYALQNQQIAPTGRPSPQLATEW